MPLRKENKQTRVYLSPPPSQEATSSYCVTSQIQVEKGRYNTTLTLLSIYKGRLGGFMSTGKHVLQEEERLMTEFRFPGACEGCKWREATHWKSQKGDREDVFFWLNLSSIRRNREDGGEGDSGALSFNPPERQRRRGVAAGRNE